MTRKNGNILSPISISTRNMQLRATIENKVEARFRLAKTYREVCGLFAYLA